MRRFSDWRYVVLGVIRDSQVHSLQEIYEIVETGQVELIPDLFNSRLLEGNPGRGNRPRYQHNIQATACKLVNEGLAQRVQRGYYRITKLGLDWLPD
ncbi:MAG: winged helix-turn-helix domain-containing protein [Dehalococcoidia bacterium]